MPTRSQYTVAFRLEQKERIAQVLRWYFADKKAQAKAERLAKLQAKANEKAAATERAKERQRQRYLDVSSSMKGDEDVQSVKAS